MQFTSQASICALALVACAVGAVHSAGGIKGGPRGEETQQRFQAVKGPAALRPPQQQQYLPPPPPPQQQVLLPPPQQIALPPPPQQQILLPPPPPPQQILLPPPPRPVAQAIKGPGRVAPIFSAARVQPVVQQAEQQTQVQVQEQEPEPAAQQQQQQQVQVQEEVDPNAAAQDAAPAVVAPARAAPANEEEANPRPEPYAFQYQFAAGDGATAGSSAREEQQDASGRITGKQSRLCFQPEPFNSFERFEVEVGRQFRSARESARRNLEKCLALRLLANSGRCEQVKVCAAHN